DVRMVVLNEARKSGYSMYLRADKMYHDLRDMYWWPRMKRDILVYMGDLLHLLANGTESVRDKIRLEYCLSFSDGWTKKCWSPVLWAEIGEASLIGPKLVLETTDKVVLIKEKLKEKGDEGGFRWWQWFGVEPSAVGQWQWCWLCSGGAGSGEAAEWSRWRCGSDGSGDGDSGGGSGVTRWWWRMGESGVGDRVPPWKGIMCFGKKGKLAPRCVGPFEILERIDLVAYRLRLPEELNIVHDTFHVSNLKKCLVDANLHVPLDEIKVDKTLCFVEEPVEIIDREIKKLKHRKIRLVKVRWNSKRRPEFTWEQKDQMRIKRVTCEYPWPGLRGNNRDFGMIRDRLWSSAWCLSD
nr:putative reverse transcriptase domain-containing protein [Tanacetum cinerariifolium]